MTTNHPGGRGASPLTTILYTLAAIAFVLALALILAVFNIDGLLESNLFLLYSLVGPLAGPLMDGILSALRFTGGLLATTMGIASVALVGVGKLLSQRAGPTAG